MTDSYLYPVNNKFRFNRLLNGTWSFELDPDNKGLTDQWFNQLPHPEEMPVPGTFAEITTKREVKYYTGNFWYATDVFVPSFLKGKEIMIRFGSITHRARIFLNGKEVCQHEGGFLPFEAKITACINFDQPNHLAVLVNNELSEKTIPCGKVVTLPNGRKLAQPYFDFFNFSGIMRNVWLEALPKNRILDFDLNYHLGQDEARIDYQIKAVSADVSVKVEVSTQGKVVAQGAGNKGTLNIEHDHLWNLNDPFLYQFKITMYKDDQAIDQYTAPIGIRTIKIDNEQILLNNKPVYLKGFGKHEDFDILGKAVNESVIKRDFECMKWTGANCFRTSHYPYAEEWYQYADRYGFLIIDEVPAVGLSNHSFVQIATNAPAFFKKKTTPELQKVHMQQIGEMIQRDKNHPSVIMWSLFNEPESTNQYAYQYFKEIFAYARKLDPQARPFTGTLENLSTPDKDLLHKLVDVVCLNRYYGWYMLGGPQFLQARDALIPEMDEWRAKKLNKPFLFTEFGADTLSNSHHLPSEMWSQEYQKEYYQMYFDIFKKYSFIRGELVWNFADFKTPEGIVRVGGNEKGIFTRERQHKDVAYLLRKRWQEEV